MKHLMIIVLFTIVFFSCNKQEKEEGKTPVARVFDKYLYKEDLKDIVPAGLSPEDSIGRVRNYIDMWVKKQALMKTAELNLAEEQKDVSQELEDYRMTLLISRYKQIFMEQNLDTIITEEQIEDYYNAHPEVFKITQPAVIALYIKVLKTSPNIDVIKNKYRSSRERDIEELKNLCTESAAEYDDFNNEWIYFRDLIVNIPVRIDNQEKFLKTNKYIEAEDENYFYFVAIKNYRLKGATAPVKFVRGQISVGILNERKEKLIRELENNIYNNMLDNQEIEIIN
ncbi:MAG: hypothetical protein L3J74_08170 [Bacteroidales bacterium]|nr:hypothetical protein [Bacteroidales bacterium]